MQDLQELLSKFRDPKSPYYIAPGTHGPAHPDDHSTSHHHHHHHHYNTFHGPATTGGEGKANLGDQKFGEGTGYAASKGRAFEHFESAGYDTKGTLEWPVAWGDCDMFQ